MSDALRVGGFLAPVFAAAAVGTAFLPAFLVTRGLDAASIGTLLAVGTVVRMLAVPVWGVMADRSGRTPVVLMAGCLVAAAAAAALLPASGFWALLVLAAVQGLGAAALMPLADALSLGLASRGRLDYGRVRGSASAVFTAATAAAGALIQAFGPRVVPILSVVCYGVAAGIARLLPGDVAGRRAGFGGILGLLGNRAFLLTVGASACVQGAHGALYVLGTLHWQAHGISSATIGLLWSEAVVAETLFFVFGRAFAERLGPAGMTAIAAGSAVLRWTVTGLSTDLSWLIAVQWLHGATFGMQHLSAMQMLSRHVPPERAGAAQTLHAALGGALPVGIASWLAGWIYDGSGGAFLLMGGLGGLGLLLTPGLYRVTAAARR